MHALKLVALVCLSFALNGCLFNVSGQSQATYPVSRDGVVDMRLAPVEDIQNLTLSFFLPPGFEDGTIYLQCKGGLAVTGSNGLQIGADLGPVDGKSLFSATLDITNLSKRGCYEDTENGFAAVLVANLGFVRPPFGLFVPVLSDLNVGCILERVESQEEPYWLAHIECLAVDSREAGGPFGFNNGVSIGPGPEEVNELTILLPEGISVGPF